METKEELQEREENGLMSEDDLSLKDLDNYYGTENYYNVLGFKVTDGVAYIMKNGYSWFVTDFLSVALLKVKKEWIEESFISLKLVVDKDKKTCQMLVTDGNEKELYKQDYEWTTAKRDLNLYLINGVLLLSREY